MYKLRKTAQLENGRKTLIVKQKIFELLASADHWSMSAILDNWFQTNNKPEDKNETRV